jgi:hypothetical protein
MPISQGFSVGVAQAKLQQHARPSNGATQNSKLLPTASATPLSELTE